MSFELENPEIAELVDQYKQGLIGYMDAKDKVVSQLASDISTSFLSERKVDELKEKAKKLLLGE